MKKTILAVILAITTLGANAQNPVIPLVEQFQRTISLLLKKVSLKLSIADFFLDSLLSVLKAS